MALLEYLLPILGHLDKNFLIFLDVIAFFHIFVFCLACWYFASDFMKKPKDVYANKVNFDHEEYIKRVEEMRRKEQEFNVTSRVLTNYGKNHQTGDKEVLDFYGVTKEDLSKKFD